ncbi:hypothetical protein [Nocardiopsis kunsanensis]|nr:hypothetical protein [Nocardiopsis kunsanensis]
MLLPDESAVLRKVNGRSPRQWLAVAVVVLTLTAVPPMVFLWEKGAWDHLRGRSEPVTALVVSVRPDGSCRASEKYRVDVVWNVDDAVPGRGNYTRCGNAPREGTHLQTWVGPNGHVNTASPETDRFFLSVFSLCLGAAGSVFGVIALLVSGRRARRLLAVGNRELSPTVPVRLRRGYESRLFLRPAEPTLEMAEQDTDITLILYNRPGASPVLRTWRKMTGPWQLRLTPAVGRRKRIGLLERGQERCWIEFSGRRR